MRPILAYLALAALLLETSCKPKLEETMPKTGPVTEAVFASGTIEPKDAYTLTSISDGFVLKSFVSENDFVKKGQLLFRLDNRQQNTQVQIAETNVTLAELNASGSSPVLLQIKAQIDAAKVKMEADSMTKDRYERLYKTHSVSRQELDNASVAYQSSLSNYRSQMENYRATAERMRQELSNTRSQLRNARAGNQYYDLTAMADGKVYQVFKKTGDLVRKGDKVAQIGNPDSLIIYLDIDESSIAKVKEGQQVLVELNTRKDEIFEARISKIYPHFNETTQSYKAEARMTGDAQSIISGTQLQANIIVNKKENAILIPHVFVKGGDKVFVKKSDEIDTVKITTGIVSEEWIEVLSGVSANDKIIKLK